MRIRVLPSMTLAASLLLAACGGGGGGGADKGDGLPIVDLTPNLPLETVYTLEAEIAASDVKAADETRLDLYKVTPPEEVALSVEMRSGDVDSYLMLFSDDCVDEKDFGDWEGCLIEEEDALGAGPEDAMIGHVLEPGASYIVAARSRNPGEYGPYTLIAQMMPAARLPARER